jgi:hypothetical protein
LSVNAPILLYLRITSMTYDWISAAAAATTHQQHQSEGRAEDYEVKKVNYLGKSKYRADNDTTEVDSTKRRLSDKASDPAHTVATINFEG